MKVHHIWKWLFEMLRILLIAICGYLLLLMFFHYMFQQETVIRYHLILIIFQLMGSIAGFIALEYRRPYLLTASAIFGLLFSISIYRQIELLWKEYEPDQLAFYTPIICALGLAAWIFRSIRSLVADRKVS